MIDSSRPFIALYNIFFSLKLNNLTRVGAFQKLLGNILSTSRISSNFFHFEELFAVWAICLVIS